MSPELTQAVPLCRNLPSPTGVAMRIITLAQDPDADIGTATELIAMDPALSARILRLANSPLLANRRRIDNLQQAVTKLGLHPTLQLALGFSLLTGLDSLHAEHQHIWRRSLIAAVAARAIGRALGVQKSEELMLAGLLQDIGALFLVQSLPEQYLAIRQQADGDNRQLLALEHRELGATHADIGVALARRWNLPDYLAEAIAASEDPQLADNNLLRSICASGQLADLWLSKTPEQRYRQTSLALTAITGLPDRQLDPLLEQIQQMLPEAASLFETPLTTPAHIQDLLAQAEEISQLRQVRQSQEAELLRERSDTLERQALELSSMANRDGLTGTINRGHFEQLLLSAFDTASQLQRPLSLAFIDLDDFKKINDLHGHLVGDDVLKAVAGHLQAQVRTVDCVARYGGEEFVIIFTDTPLQGALGIINRVLQGLSQQPVAVVDGRPLHVTFSAGIACHDQQTPFASARSLLDAADRALYLSKGQGRNRVAGHAPVGEDVDNQA